MIRSAREGSVGWDSIDEADFTYLVDPSHVLLRNAEDAVRVGDALERTDEFEGRGDLVESLFPAVARYRLPTRRDSGATDVDRALELIAADPSIDLVTPEHLLHICSNGSCCPATEPAETGLDGPWPRMTPDPDAGDGVRVLVIDTGIHLPATTDGRTPWLDGVSGDAEPNGPILDPYAGHGTFAAGVVRCRAPKATVEVLRFTVDASGAVSEIEIADLLGRALESADPPDVISLSAGTYTRLHRPLLAFQVLWDNTLQRMPDTVVVAAAGNDSRYAPFWPAAFDWAVGVGSLDRDDRISSYSNFGPSADVFALGRNHVNAFPDGSYVCNETPDKGDQREFGTGLARWSGTSFSTPMVAGMIAAEISGDRTHRRKTPRQARDSVLSQAGPRSDQVRGPYRALPIP
ncbi:S8/S53 family peptidase [Microlunatus ginsengisoli]|uniref:S8/S53 family peptidase n=1 Tax=Microlunatus ginsengisoli TaxID=363863 RepID=A0ABP7A530_9ACTN